jgi:predicted nucleotidyltransferase
MIADERARKIISDIVEKLIKGYQPDKIILFGSYAYGEPTEDSDVLIPVFGSKYEFRSVMLFPQLWLSYTA